MASFTDVDKHDVNALHLLGALKAVISDVKKQDSNKTPNDKTRAKDGKKNNGNQVDTTTTSNAPTWEQVEQILTNYTYHIVALIKDSKSATEDIVEEVKDENKNWTGDGQ